MLELSDEAGDCFEGDCLAFVAETAEKCGEDKECVFEAGNEKEHKTVG